MLEAEHVHFSITSLSSLSSPGVLTEACTSLFKEDPDRNLNPCQSRRSKVLGISTALRNFWGWKQSRHMMKELEVIAIADGEDEAK